MGFRTKVSVGAVLLFLVLGGPALAQVEEEAPDPKQAALGPGSGEEVPPEGEGGPSVTLGEVMYVVAKGAGVVVLDVSDPLKPVVLEVLLSGHDVLALEIVGGQLIVILEDYVVVAFDLSDPRHPVEAAGVAEGLEEQEEEVLEVEGSVVSVDTGWVVLDVGSSDGVEPGMRFAIRHAKAKPWTRPLAIVVVSAVEEGTCAGPLPSRASAKPGYRAVMVREPWRAKYWMVASAPAPYTRLVLELRPILGAGPGTGSGGFISHLELFHQFERPWGVGFVLSPAGMGVSRAGVGALFELGAVGGYSGRYFGFELGAGAHLSAGLDDDSFLALSRVRLGPVSGVHGNIRLSFVPDRAWYIPSTASLTLFFPIRLRLDLFVELSGGNRSLIEHGRTGWANILGGMRAWVRGNGGPGTVILSAGLGHGYVWDEMCEDEDGHEIPCRGGSTFGPLVSLGVEWRF